MVTIFNDTIIFGFRNQLVLFMNKLELWMKFISKYSTVKILYTCVRNCKTYLSHFTVYEIFFEFIEIVTKLYNDNLCYNYFIIFYGNRN